MGGEVIMPNTTEIDVINSFHSHPMSKSPLPTGLEHQFFLNALAQYELEIGELGFDDTTDEFASKIDRGATKDSSFAENLVDTMLDKGLLAKSKKTTKGNTIKTSNKKSNNKNITVTSKEGDN